MSADSAPVPDLHDLIFEMGKLHKECIKRDMIEKDIFDLFMDELREVTDKEEKKEMAQRRIAFLTKQLAPQTIPFANGGAIIEKLPTVVAKHLPVEEPVSVHVKKETAAQPLMFKMRFAALQSILFQRKWCYEYMLKYGT